MEMIVGLMLLAVYWAVGMMTALAFEPTSRALPFHVTVMFWPGYLVGRVLLWLLAVVIYWRIGSHVRHSRSLPAVDTSDIPETDAAWFERAKLRSPER